MNRTERFLQCGIKLLLYKLHSKLKYIEIIFLSSGRGRSFSFRHGDQSDVQLNKPFDLC